MTDIRKAAGNSVCPQQAFEAIRQLWTRIVASESALTEEENNDEY